MARKSLSEILGGMDKIASLKIIREVPTEPGNARLIECLCDCGNIKVFWLGNVKSGKSSSCGCQAAEKIRKARTTHGESSRRRRGAVTAEYRVWSHMIGRCHDQNDGAYHNYGGRGILVCDRWRNSYQHFLKDMGRRPTSKHQIDRTDNSLGYHPVNCKWVSYSEQCRNKRTNRYVNVNGKVMILKDAAELIGVDRRILGEKIKSGPYMGVFECKSKTA